MSITEASWKHRIRMFFSLGDNGSFRRSAITLTTGTAIAQILPLTLYPVFTRFFSPEQFGVNATVSFVSTLAAMLATGQYEGTLILAPSRRVASHIVAYILMRSALVFAGLTVLIGILHRTKLRIAIDPLVMSGLPAVPVIAAATAAFSTYTEWCVRGSRFSELATVRVWQASATSACRLLLGAIGVGGNGLVASDLIGRSLVSIRCAVAFWKTDKVYLFVQSFARIRAAANQHSRVAKFLLPDQLVSVLGGSLHVVILGTAFGAESLGYVSVVSSALYAPITVVSSAVKDVFRQRAAVEYVRDGSCRATYRRLMLPLIVIATLGFGTFYAVAPSMFPVIFGRKWAVASDFARILTPMFFFNFVSMSLGGVLVIAERSDVSLAWQVSGLIVTGAALAVGAFIFKQLTTALWLMSLVRAASYAAYMVLSYHYAQRPKVG